MARERGLLSVCATPIGNLGDVTLRVLDALRAADVIIAEDTRVTRKLLARYDIHTPLERYDAATASERTPALVERIHAGAHVALVSDAGTPGISDPGVELVDACLEAGLPVEVLPGPSAVIAALAASGLGGGPFYFGGFLPRAEGERRRRLEALAELDAALVFFESPRRLVRTLASLAGVLPDRTVAVVREVTKVHEEVVRGPADVVARGFQGREVRGEVVLVIDRPASLRPTAPDPGELVSEVQRLMGEGRSQRDAVREVAQRHGVARNALYRRTIEDAR